MLFELSIILSSNSFLKPWLPIIPKIIPVIHGKHDRII